MITIQGKKYSFEIVSYNGKVDFCFFIRARCKSTRRFSCINNLDTILSMFNISIDDPKVADSMWIDTKNEVNKFVKIAQQFLLDSSFLNYLESRLDDDRKLGEWENIFKRNSKNYNLIFEVKK